jgi:integrase/recombinase XerC
VSYAERTKRPPRTLTDREVKKILDVTGKAKDGFRDHMIISLALGCGLRESEIVALTIDDVAKPDGKSPKRIIQLQVFKRGGQHEGADPNFQRVHVPDATYYKLEKYLKAIKAFEFYRETPIFTSRQEMSLSTRQVRRMWREWQQRADFDQLYPFHSLRHTAITNVRRASKDIRIAQKFARHVNIRTTVRYEHASDEEVARAVKDLAA